MAARGPDGRSHWSGGNAALGQCMLRTTPESLEENQPLASEDRGLVLVLDGRVDNREEVRHALIGRGIALRDRSDAELVLRAYEAWGDDCPDRLVGEFAFFIWDARRRRLFGARDAAGTRHFYYHAGDGWFAFASEIRGLLAAGLIEPRLNESRLLDYVVVEFDRDDEIGTFYQGIERLPAGHAMQVTGRGATSWRYWKPCDLPATRFGSLDECAEAFVDRLRIAVKCRLRSNGPVGAMLSGGLDSSSIVGLIRKEFRGELAQPLKTFSLIRKHRERCADWHAIQLMLAEGGLDPTIIDSGIAREVCRGTLDRIADLDEPFPLSGAFTYSLIYGAARDCGCRVVFDGMAGDLLFYSFARSLAHPVEMARHVPAILAAGRRHNVPHPVRVLAWRALAAAAPAAARALYRRLRDRYAPPLDELRLLHRKTARRMLASKHAARERAGAYARPRNDQAAHASHFMSGMLSFGHEALGGIALAQGVEPRSPFSDRRMIEFAVQMPVEAKLYAGWYKRLLRQGMAGIIPDQVRWRRDTGAHPGWDFYAGLFSECARAEPEFWNLPVLQSRLSRWIDAGSLDRVWREYHGTADHAAGLSVFALAVLARWLEARFEPSPRT